MAAVLNVERVNLQAFLIGEVAWAMSRGVV
jgi:hypothetical protein